MTLFMGKVLDWTAAVWDSDPQIQSSMDYFIAQIREVFEYPAGSQDISSQLLNLRQGKNSVADYAIKFLMLATQS